MSWIEAQGECEILGGFLAEVKTEGEHEFLKGVTGLLEVRQDVLEYLNGSLNGMLRCTLHVDILFDHSF